MTSERMLERWKRTLVVTWIVVDAKSPRRARQRTMVVGSFKLRRARLWVWFGAACQRRMIEWQA